MILLSHAYQRTLPRWPCLQRNNTVSEISSKRSASSTTMAETAAGSEEPVVEQPAAGGADQPGHDPQNQDGEALGDGKVMHLWLGSNCYNV